MVCHEQLPTQGNSLKEHIVQILQIFQLLRLFFAARDVRQLSEVFKFLDIRSNDDQEVCYAAALGRESMGISVGTTMTSTASAFTISFP